jgi:prepilin-type N-terminal cleavage/methylation domain-containing protein
MRPSTSTAALSTAARRGFSLVELLVVLGIIAAMAGLVLGGLFRSRDGNRLLAAEQILADAIRQGRHTARSTGAPVELRITPTVRGGEVIGAKVSGVSQTILWSETFDGKHDANEDGVVDGNDLGGLELPAHGKPTNGVVIGRSGNGRRPSAEHPIPVQLLPRGATIVRAGKTDGFYLACSVKPRRISGLDLSILPLVMIGPDEVGDYSKAQCGIGMQTVQHRPQVDTGPDGQEALITTWELTGFVRDDSGNPTNIFAVDHQIVTRLDRESWNGYKRPEDQTWRPNSKEIANPISGGEWVDVGLLYDGRLLALYLNGRRIAVRREGVPPRLLPDSDRLHIGQRLTSTTPQTYEYADVAIDDVRLYRLGGGDVAELPGNVVLVTSSGAAPSAKIGWRITCQPDGRVEMYRDDDDDDTDPRAVNDRVVEYEDFEFVKDTKDEDGDGDKEELIKRLKKRVGDTATIILGQLRAPGTIQNAELTVTRDGRVLSRLITAGSGNDSPGQQDNP